MARYSPTIRPCYVCCRMSLRLLPSLRMGPLYGRRHCVHSCTSVAASAVAAAKPQPPAVDPPPLVGFSPDTINSVVVSGLALSEPRVHYLAANQVAAHFSLGLRPCNFRLDLPQQPQGAVFVDSWGLLALQLQQHVHKGDRVQVRGVLREDTWTDNATGKPRRAVKVGQRRGWINGLGWYCLVKEVRGLD